MKFSRSSTNEGCSLTNSRENEHIHPKSADTSILKSYLFRHLQQSKIQKTKKKTSTQHGSAKKTWHSFWLVPFTSISGYTSERNNHGLLRLYHVIPVRGSLFGRTYSIYCITICFQSPRPWTSTNTAGHRQTPPRDASEGSSWAAGQQKMVVSSWVEKSGESWAHCSTILSYFCDTCITRNFISSVPSNGAFNT